MAGRLHFLDPDPPKPQVKALRLEPADQPKILCQRKTVPREQPICQIRHSAQDQLKVRLRKEADAPGPGGSHLPAALVALA